jgi:UDP-N-acetylglucosamine diphosphorylase / glucose-1-phosphate thymidylyltransferase / UDP-N-acetylgalactosamine diphosphorylase / glucosamine-1-phosphate N-acetyltransferase / galactosamine-1-phosphate N-acetyltransferase
MDPRLLGDRPGERTQAMRVCLFEDQGWRNFDPMVYLRPVFSLLCGQTTLAAKQCRYFAPCEVAVLIRPELADVYRLHRPRTLVNDTAWLRRGPTALVNGRWLPPPDVAMDVNGPVVFLVGDEVAYAVVGPEQLADCTPDTIDDCLELWKNTLPCKPAGGAMMSYLWDLVENNGRQIGFDCRHHLLAPGRQQQPVIGLVGPQEQLRIDPTAQVDPMVVADTRNGPVVIDAGAVVQAFTRLEGPCYIGPQSHILGAKIRAGTSIGPSCRVGGEVEASIIQGWSNKYHDGFLGHSYVGKWVNLGAGCQTSDLRNDYGPVKVVVNGELVPTGSTKVGSFIGDHSKAGLGTLFNSGSSVGIFCNLLPSGGYVPKYVPSFASWWNGSLEDRADLAEQERTAGQVMKRRGWAFSEVHASLVRSVHEQTAPERRRALLQAEQRRLRRSA